MQKITNLFEVLLLTDDIMKITDLPWDFVASASHFSYSSLETLSLDYQFACTKFGLDPHSHARISKVADDEFRLCISMNLSQLIDENPDAFMRPPTQPENTYPQVLKSKLVSSFE